MKKILESDLVLTQQAEAAARYSGMSQEAKYDYLKDINAQLSREVADAVNASTIREKQIHWGNLIDVVSLIGADIALKVPYYEIINYIEYAERKLIEGRQKVS